LLVVYLAVLVHARNLAVEHEWSLRSPGDDSLEWLMTEGGLERLAEEWNSEGSMPQAQPVLERWTLIPFFLACAAGWLLTPVVALSGWLARRDSEWMVAWAERVAAVQATLRQRSKRALTVSVVATIGVTGLGSLVDASAAGPRPRGNPVARPTTTAVVAAPAPASGPRYTVRPGDTLWGISQRYDTTVGAMVAANDIATPNLIFPGQSFVVGTNEQREIPTAPAVKPVARPSRAAVVRAAARAKTSKAPAAKRTARPSTGAPVLVALRSGAGPAPRPVPAAAPAHPAAPAPAPKPAPAPPQPSSGYVNPFRSGSWSPARTDQGVDWIPNGPSPVVAIGDGVVTYSSTSSGWPGGGFITYRLSNGSHAGLYIYVAEHLTNLLPVGTRVSAGQTIATALPGYPWTEWGWASPSGPSPAPSAQYGGAANGSATAGGKAFARFLIEIGARPLQDPGPGPDRP
jgi:murein DD-endopeptidase MepM/ murein hydrolase activator NlpD